MDITGSFTSTYIKNVTDSLLQKIVSVPTGRGGFSSFQLFKECTVDRENDYSEWYIEIDAHDKALPLMFDIQDRYMTYELWNVLILKSVNQIRMYEILKQYEKISERTFKLEDLKALLGVDKKEYTRFNNFSSKVLKVCQQALKEYTDIKFEWEVSKRGQRGKILELKFFISKNDDYQDISNLDFYLKNYAYQPSQSLDNEPTEENIIKIEEQPLLLQSEPQKQNPPIKSFGTKKILETDPSELPITKKDIEYAQQHKLWKYASEIANNHGINNPAPYATRIILRWDSKGYKSKNDLVRKREIHGEVTNYDLDLISDVL
jgi:hypothetical protein